MRTFVIAETIEKARQCIRLTQPQKPTIVTVPEPAEEPHKGLKGFKKSKDVPVDDRFGVIVSPGDFQKAIGESDRGGVRIVVVEPMPDLYQSAIKSAHFHGVPVTSWS